MDLMSSEDRRRSAGSRHSPHDFPGYLTYACSQLEAPFDVKINVQIQDDYHRPEEKNKKLKRAIRATPVRDSPRAASQPLGLSSGRLEEQELELSSGQFLDVPEIVLTAVMDSAGHLVEIIFNRCVAIPRLLIKVIGVCIPYHHHLHRLTVRWGPLSTVALYEFSKYLSHPYLTEICLDDSPVAGRNYEVLLQQPSHLHYLSLARCKLDDADCAKLAALLAYPQPAAATLHVLVLASNRIGDAGARALAALLRNNRGLHSLDLAGNCLTDAGAVCILRTLMEFPLTTDELIEKRKRNFEYLRRRTEVFAMCVKELSQEKSQDEVRLSKRRPVSRGHRKVSLAVSVAQALHERAEAMTDEIVGEFSDPFNKEQTMARAGQLYSVGNTTLCCLNLAYNNLEYGSLTALFEVLTHQSWLGARAAPGLLRVCVEGNNLPVDCDQLFLLEDLLERAVAARLLPLKRSTAPERPRVARIAPPNK